MSDNQFQKEKQAHKQIQFGAIISYVALLVNIAFSLFYYPWMVEKVGKSSYGLYNLAISLVSLFMFDFGLSTVVSRYVAKYIAEKKQNYADEFVGTIFRIFLGIDILIFIVLAVLFFLLDRIYHGLTTEEMIVFKRLFIIVSGFIVISYPMTPLNGIISAYERFVPLKMCELINRVLSGLMVVLALLFDAGVESLVFAYTFAGFIVIIIKIIIVYKQTPLRVSFKNERLGVYKGMLSFSIWTFIISLASRVTAAIVPSVLAMTTNSGDVALYSPAAAIEAYYFGIANAINGLFLPMVSRLVAEDRESAILPLMAKVGRYQSAVLGFLLVGLFCIGDDFMTLWMGKDFYNSYYCLLLLCLPSFFRYSQQIGNTAVVVKGFVREQAVLSTISTGIVIIACYLMSLRWGVIGGSAAICLGGLLTVVGSNWIYQKKVGIDIKRFYRDSYGKIIIPILVTAVVGRILSVLIGSRGVISFLLKGTLITIIYVVFLWIYALDIEEKNMQ